MKFRKPPPKPKIQYFPFAPGIPFTTIYSIVQPNISGINIWESILKDKHPVIVVFGGIFETFISLMFAEAMNYLFPDKHIHFICYKRFKKLIDYNGLSEYIEIGLNQYLLSKYPVPIFLDQTNFFYYNPLHNFYNEYTFWGKRVKRNINPAIQHIFSNTTLSSFNYNYLPKLRQLPQSDYFKRWLKENKLDLTQPFITFIPHTGLSLLKKGKSLHWKQEQILEFIQLCKANKQKLVIITDQPQLYNQYGTPTIPVKMEYIFNLLSHTKYLLSEEVDYLLIGGVINNKITLFYDYIYRIYRLLENLKFCQQNEITIHNIDKESPLQVMEKICQKPLLA